MQGSSSTNTVHEDCNRRGKKNRAARQHNRIVNNTKVMKKLFFWKSPSDFAPAFTCELWWKQWRNIPFHLDCRKPRARLQQSWGLKMYSFNAELLLGSPNLEHVKLLLISEHAFLDRWMKTSGQYWKTSWKDIRSVSSTQWKDDPMSSCCRCFNLSWAHSVCRVLFVSFFSNFSVGQYYSLRPILL